MSDVEVKKYQVVDGTHYDSRTPLPVIRWLEYSRIHRLRLVITYGDTGTGKAWESCTPYRGHIGRSTGTQKIPLLIRTRRSLGGEALLDHCIVKIQESKGGKVIYQLITNQLGEKGYQLLTK